MIIKYEQYKNKRSRKLLKEKLFEASGVYAFSYAGRFIYVGATSNLFTRIFRIYRENHIEKNIIFRELMRRIGSFRAINIHIYFCTEKKLRNKERQKLSLLEPISQTFIYSQDYRGKRK